MTEVSDMGLYIPMMEMPKSCLHCQMSIPDESITDLYCCLIDEPTNIKNEGRLPDCPLVYIPDEFITGEKE